MMYLRAQKSNSNTVWFNFQTYIYINLEACILFISVAEIKMI